jgi:hypothetical protein
METERFVIDSWGTDEIAVLTMPGLAQDRAFRRWFAKSMRSAANAQEAAATLTRIRSMDVRQVLPTVSTPALVIHRKGFEWVPIEQSRYLTDHLP